MFTAEITESAEMTKKTLCVLCGLSGKLFSILGGGERKKMSGKSMVNMQIVVEKVENMDEFLVRGGYYGSGIDMEHLVLDVLLSIDELFHQSVGLEVEELTEKKTKGKIVVNMQIAAEEIETLGGLQEEDFIPVWSCV